MSTDLHLHHDLPKLRIAAPVKIEDHVDVDVDVVDVDVDVDVVDIDIVPSSPDPVSSVVAENQIDIGEGAGVIEDKSYRTPTSKESKIPAMMTCPPAPRKPKPVVTCKRKLLDFFEVTNEDMDTFFRSTFPKRTCPCT